MKRLLSIAVLALLMAVAVAAEPTAVEAVDTSIEDETDVSSLSAEPNVYYIYTAEDMYNVRNDLAGTYYLMNDIDLSVYENWEPIGNDDNQFTGIFDGKNYKILGASMMFYYNSGTIKNIGVSGVLVSKNHGTIDNCFSTGTVHDVNNTNTYYSSASNYGGLVHDNFSVISNSFSIGEIIVEKNLKSTFWISIGGLSGTNTGTISNCFSEARVTIRGTVTNTSGEYGVQLYAGGLVGKNSGLITNSYAIGEVYSYAKLNSVTNYGGYSRPDAYSYAGGLVGYNIGTVLDCYAKGEVSSYAYANPLRDSYSYAGGLVGGDGKYVNGSEIKNCYANGNVTSHSESYNHGATGYTGGLIGVNFNSIIVNCFATGDSSTGVFSNLHSEYGVGGLIGMSNSPIANCYSTGVALSRGKATNGHVYGYGSGLIGINNSKVTSCYTTRSSLIHKDAHSTNCYYYNDNEIEDETGVPNNCLTDQQMKIAANYVGFDFDNIWAIDESAENPINSGYPYLRMTDYEYADSLTLNINETEVLSNGQVVELIPTIMPTNCDDKSITWSSSNENVATIDQYGVVTAHSTGTAIIYAKTAYDLHSVACKVYVKNSFKLFTVEDLYNIRNDYLADYFLMNDIDMSSVDNWIPIGDEIEYFKGTLDGNGYKIKGLRIEPKNVDDNKIYYGVFAFNDGNIKNIGVEGTINVNLSDVDVSKYYVGGLVGNNLENGTITNCYSNVDVNSNLSFSTNTDSYIGGLVGLNKAKVTNCYSESRVFSNVSSKEYNVDNYVGGLIGYNTANILNCYSQGDVKSMSLFESDVDCYIGGLIGYGNGDILNCYSSGSVIAEHTSSSLNVFAGGLVGKGSSIENCYSTGNVKSISISKYKPTSYIGGLAGYTVNDTVNCYSSGEVTSKICCTYTSSSGTYATAKGYIGGLIGYASRKADVQKCYSTSDITSELISNSSTNGTTYDYAGGLVGLVI